MIYFLGAGSNEGDRGKNLLHALYRLQQETQILAIAPLIENPPLLPKDAPESWYRPFLNTVIQINWSESPENLLLFLKKIENELGRSPQHERWSPRSLDLDILCTEPSESFVSRDLQIPHQHVLERSFTLNPLTHLNAQLKINDTTVLETLRKNQKTVPYLMAVFNCTPDSFSNSPQDNQNGATELLTNFKKLLDSHVPFIDLGAESTRPGATFVDSATEIERLKPLLEYWKTVRTEHPWTTLSIDTRHPGTASFALDHGVTILNDVSHLSHPQMKDIAMDFKHIIFMHSLTIPADKNTMMDSLSPISEQISSWCLKKLEEFKSIPLNKLIFDPGIGFNKTPLQSLRLLQEMDCFKTLPTRLLVGHSRKSFMNLWTEEAFFDRDYETLGVSLALAQKPINILRVHNVETHKRAQLSYQCLQTPL